ncbi:hypothetical protein NDU88_007881 [Pleurodeles waltl]|uniref:Secreted protein n=1 Tax=Pleurodeles waltl TaxID=8319 RepID=A0AAV7SU21_PLEWA|nr:hypothetical protein NDU88_007881 [Pleurodeles waltl]
MLRVVSPAPGVGFSVAFPAASFLSCGTGVASFSQPRSDSRRSFLRTALVTLHGCVRRKQLGTAVRVEKASHTTIRKSRGAGCDLSASVSDAARRFSCSGRRFFGRVSCGVVSQLRNRRRVVFSAAIGFASIFSPHGARCVYFCP